MGKEKTNGMRIFSILKDKQHFKVILYTITLFIAASLITGGVFFVLNVFLQSMLISFAVAYTVGLTAIVFMKSVILAKYEKRKRKISISIKKLGEGYIDSVHTIDKERIFPEIASSVDFANRELSDKLKSIIKNTQRLTYIEEELTSRFRPKDSVDKKTKDLVCQLKICASRLRNDVGDFTFRKKEKVTQ